MYLTKVSRFVTANMFVRPISFHFLERKKGEKKPLNYCGQQVQIRIRDIQY